MIERTRARIKLIPALLASLSLIAGISLSSDNITAYADVGTNQQIQEYINGDMSSNSINNSIITGNTQLDEVTYPRQNYNYYQGKDNNYYYVAKADEQTLGASISNYSTANPDTVGQQVKDVTKGLNLGADVDTASNALSGFTPIISILLGLMVILISIGMTIFSAFDLCYIAFPVFRNKCEEAKQSGQGVMASGKKGSNGETKLRFVSDDAQYSVSAADTVQSGKNPFVIYFGKRLLSYIILAILLFILLTGNITIFTNLALKVVSGILDLIQRL